MLVTAIRKDDGLFIPPEYLKTILEKEFTQIVLDIQIIEYKNETVKKTAGLLKNRLIDSPQQERKARKETDRNVLS